jgi:hypothetical protein
VVSRNNLLLRRPLLIPIKKAFEEYFCKQQLLMEMLLALPEETHLPVWKHGVAQLTFSLTKIHQALDVADSEISKWIVQGLEEASKELAQDADIAEIAICSLTTDRDRYLSQAHQQEALLIRKLQPQWESRDQVKQRMGTDRAVGQQPIQLQRTIMPTCARNTTPNREIFERRCNSFLESIDTTPVETTSKLLKDNLHSSSKRYNDQRPIDYSRRVDWDYILIPPNFDGHFPAAGT